MGPSLAVDGDEPIGLGGGRLPPWSHASLFPFVPIPTLGYGRLPSMVKTELAGDAAFRPDEIHKKPKGYKSSLHKLLVFPFIWNFPVAVGGLGDCSGVGDGQPSLRRI